MVKIRLRRMGAKKAPFYRKIDAEKAKQWLDNGAQPTDTVREILKKAAVL